MRVPTCVAPLVVIVSLLAVGLAQEAAIPAQPADFDKLYAGFLGDWVGQLEYRDFSSNERVFLPTWLTVSRRDDGRSLQFAYVYDDGPNKTVKETSVVAFDVTAGTATFASDRDHSSDTYKVAGFEEFASTGRGRLLLTGRGTENNKKVDIRITMTLRRNLYTYRKETRLPGQNFLFRDGYTFTRKESLK